MIYRFLLRTIIFSPTPSFPSSVRFPPWGATHSCPLSLSSTGPPFSTQVHPSTWAPPVSFRAYQDPLLPGSAITLLPTSSPRLPDSRLCTLSATRISSNLSLSCFRADFFLHHGSRHLPHHLYTVSLSQTL